MGDPVEELVGLLELEPSDDRCFRAPGVETGRPRLYGGQVVAQAVMAAGRVAGPDRLVHSLHGYFLATGTASASVDHQVSVLRESGSFTVCRVDARQAGRSLMTLTTSFHVPEDGPDLEVAPPPVPPPDAMAPLDEWLLAQPDPATHADLPHFADAFDVRQATESYEVDAETGRGRLRDRARDIWIRATGRLPDDPLVHACVVAYVSDKPALGTTVLGPPLDGDPSGHLVASLDHSMWFHRPCRADEWMHVHCETATAAGARAFARMEVYGPDGRLAVSATQEGLVRRSRPR
jgi:acyl-CoA thioesterase-2